MYYFFSTHLARKGEKTLNERNEKKQEKTKSHMIVPAIITWRYAEIRYDYR